MASGVSNTFRQVGLAVGIAALGALLPAGATGQAATFAAALDHMRDASAATVAAGAVVAVLLVRARDFVAEPLPAAAAAGRPPVPAPQARAHER
jgi:hypothetical protein